MTEIWAHRGASAHAPENTLAAFELALRQGAEGVEFDVQLSSDGAPVLIHDEKVDRTTNGRGWVKDHPLAALQALDASNGRDGFARARIPTLPEALELLAPSGVTINIELKNSEIRYSGLEEIVLEAVDTFGICDRVVLSSFNHYSLKRLQDLGARCPLGVIYTDPLYRPWRYAAELGAAALHPPRRLILGPGYVRRAHEAGLAVRPWVVNSERDLRRMFRLGVDAVFTDVPDVALAVRAASLTS